MNKYMLAVTASLLLSFTAFAQKGNIGFVYPAGGQRGSTFELTVGGQNLSKAQGIIVSGEGVTGELIPAPKGTKPRKRKKKNIGEEDNLQLSDKVRFRVTIAGDATPGIRDLRLIMPNGMTNRLYFEVGELADVCENPKQQLSATAESLPVTFNGQVMRSDVDRFRFPANKGQNLVIRVKARVFVPYMADAVPGWFQPIIRLYGPGGSEVAFNDDYTFHVDPVILYKVPESGNYEIEINDALYRGREDFVYRIDVGELPFITGISPLGGSTGKKVTLRLRGWNLKSGRLRIRPARDGFFPVRVTSASGISSNTMLFDATSKSRIDTRKMAPNTDREKAWALAYGDCVENVISASMQQHWYEFSVSGRKQAVHIEVVARRLGAPTDIRMTLFDENGEMVKDVDDFEDVDDCMSTHFADPQLTKPLNPGKYYIRIIESQGHSGEDYGYRLYLDRSSPDFSLHLDPATFAVPENGTGIFNVLLTRKQNFRGPVNIDIAGLPAGYKVAGNRILQGQKKAVVSITAPKGAEHKVVHPKVTGSASKGEETIIRTGVPVETMMQAFYYTHLMPMEEFRMEVGEELPFRIEVVQDWKGRLRLNHKEEPVPVKVRVVRRQGYNSPVTLMLKSVNGTVRAEAVVVPEGETEGTLNLILKGKHRNKREQIATVSISGVVKGSSKRIAGKSRSAFVAAVTAHAPVFEALIPAAIQTSKE